MTSIAPGQQWMVWDTSKLQGVNNKEDDIESDSAASEELELYAKVMPEIVVAGSDEESDDLMWDDDEIYMPGEAADNQFERQSAFDIPKRSLAKIEQSVEINILDQLDDKPKRHGGSLAYLSKDWTEHMGWQMRKTEKPDTRRSQPSGSQFVS